MSSPRFFPRQQCVTAALFLVFASTLPGDTVVNVRNLGAAGDGVTNDRPVFQEALEQARQSESAPVTIRIPEGQYRLGIKEDPNAKAHLQISETNDLTMTADENAVLIFSSPFHEGIGIYNSRNIRIDGLAVDYDPLPFTQGIIVGVTPDEHLIDIRIEDGFPDPRADHIDAFSGKPGKNVGYLFDPATGRKLNQFYDQYLRTRVKTLDDGIFRYKSSPGNPVKREFIGKRMAVVGRRKANAFKLNHSTDCRIENVRIFSAPACGFNVAGSSGVVINRCRIVRKPGTGRVMSTNADGLHSKWCPTGPVLSNSHFTGMGDDAVNIGGSYAALLKQVDDHTLIVKAHGSLVNHPADLVALDLDTHGHIALGPVSNIRGTRLEGFKRRCLRITFTNPLPDDLTTWEATGERRTCSRILNLNACGRGAEIIDNRFYLHRGRGVLMRAPGSLIEGNHFDTLAGPAVVISNDSGFLREGPSGNGTVVKNNTCTRIERSNIWINSSAGHSTDEAVEGVTGVKILNNRFEQYGGPNVHGRGVVGNVFLISNASDLIIADNWVGQPVSAEYRATPVLIDRVENLTWRNNRVAGRPLTPRKDIGYADD